MRRAAIFIVLSLLYTAGCAPAPLRAHIDMTASGGILWPGKPEKPRIKYLWSLQNVAAEEAAKESGSLELLFGSTDPSKARILLRPQGVYVDDRRFYIADPGAGRVTVIDRKTMEVMDITDAKGVPLAYPLSVVAGRDGRMYVSDPDLGKVSIYSEKGDFVSYLQGAMTRPAGLAIDNDRGLLYVVDSLGHCVYIYGTDGVRKGVIGKRGDGNGEFNYPGYAFVDGKGMLYVTDALNFRVQVFAPGGAFARAIGRLGDSYDTLDKPKGVAADSFGNIYVVDDGKDMVKIFNPEGRLLLFFGTTGHGYGDFYLPTGLFIDRENVIYVADTINMRVQAFQLLSGE
ncbi:MAG: SMP-30/gluconolactonase/LRE family protein [Nitrospiraceae bacterium]|nr:SMP-30/gluconolactonase/LRE family protein [Nitrospiraceae bacterium]